jgi:hypothetical protein
MCAAMVALNVDTSRAFRTLDELTGLVKAVIAASVGTDETNWIEWKSSLDLSVAEGKFVVSKAILGFANRSVDQASLACEGAAYMLIGAEPGAAAGISEVDFATLGQRLKTYVNGPRWSPHHIKISGATVLVFVVEPPRAGDPIHVLQKQYSGHNPGSATFNAGTVFTRGLPTPNLRVPARWRCSRNDLFRVCGRQT